MRVLIDTSAIVAILNKADENHLRALSLIQKARTQRVKLFMTNFLVGETYATLLSRVGLYAAREWLINNDIPAIRATVKDERDAKEIIIRYKDKDFSYVDATSFAIMKRLKMGTAFTFDNHFEQFGYNLYSGQIK
jgi:predicted nucleic acid-binding protein